MRLNGLVTSFVRTAFSQTLLNERHEALGDKEEDVSIYLDDFKETIKYWKLERQALDHTLVKSLWKWLWTCRNTDYGMMVNETYSCELQKAQSFIQFVIQHFIDIFYL
jgi:hypothetical protein